MAEHGHDVCGIALGNRWAKGWKGIYNCVKLDLEDAEISWDEELKRISSDYQRDLVASYVQADRFVSKLPADQQKKILIWTFLKIEELAERGVEIFITTGVAYLYNLVILSVSKRYGIKAFSIYGTRQPKPKFTISSGKGDVWDAVESNLNKLNSPQNSDSISAEVEYIENFRKKSENPSYMRSARQKGGIGGVFLREFIRRCDFWYLQGWNKSSDYITQNPFWYARRDLMRYLRKLYLNFVYQFSKFEGESDYFVYPLHLQPEASTLVLGQDYCNQVEVIKAISRRLPADKVLVVKEHPAAYGRHSKALYDQISGLFNVRLVGPEEDVGKLILNSCGVIVISGTMGWEALLLGKPALVLGSVFYCSFPGAVDVENLDQLSDSLNAHLRGAAKEEMALALKALERGSYDGYFDVHKLDTERKVLDPENLDAIFRGISSFIEADY